MSQKTSKHKLAQRLEALQDVTIELMSANRPEQVLQMVVNRALDLLVCDAASLYLAHPSGTHLTFEIALNRSINFEFQKMLVPVTSRGLAAYVFRTGNPLRIRDAYHIDHRQPYMFDNSFDVKVGYRTRSVLTQPLKSTHGERLGVLQLINRKARNTETWPSKNPEKIKKMPQFSKDDERLLASFAAIASAAIEYSMLYKNIENVFEGFVTASIQAIESRDLATRGHSERVCILTLDTAKNVSACEDKDIRHIRFTDQQIAELRYASLMHDFGKIGVREEVLQKEEKLSPLQQLKIKSRIDDFFHASEIQAYKNFVQQLVKENRAPTDFERAKLEKYCHQLQSQFKEYWDLILELNNPTIMAQDVTKKLDKVKQIHCLACDGTVKPIIDAEEEFSLAIRRGSLTADERLEIESHVTHTFYFLERIPWTKELKNIPEIAFTHHEFMDGSGYPRGLKAEKIAPQTRIMTICDIYDALVANDRPYKPALSAEAALDILNSMAKDGKLDRSFLRVFIESRVFENQQFRSLVKPSKKSA